MTGQPRVRNNDWSVLEVPEIGAWEPALSVSVVLPAHNPARLDQVLAGLAAQSYPSHLLEVVVVDDDSSPTVTLPEVRPENTRLVPTRGGWGRAAACQTGVEVSDGAVLHWLDSDMVPRREQVEAHLRWHHAVDYAVVLGRRLFAPEYAFDGFTPGELRDRIAAGAEPEDLVRGPIDHTVWTDPIMAETRNLCDAGPRAMRLHVGASGSVGRDLYGASGGMPTDLLLGEDMVLGYRLREAGAVFVPDPAATSVHLGASGVMWRETDTNRYNKPFITDLVPEFRGHRTVTPRSYSVPYVEVVLDVRDLAYEAVTDVVNAQLSCSLPDLVVTLVAPWSTLSDERRPVLSDPDLDLRMTRAAYAADQRVRLLDAAAELSVATFRVHLPGADEYPVGRALERLLFVMENDHLGLRTVDLTDGSEVRIERTASVARAQRIVGAEMAADVLPGVCGAGTTSAEDAGFTARAAAPRIKQLRGLVPWGVRKPD